MPASKKVLYLAVVEPSVVENGVTYKNVLRNILPDASGTIFETAWIKGQSVDVNLSGDLSNVTNKSKLKVIAFIQDDATKEIYQSVSDTLKSITTGISPSVAGNAGITVYPNPAAEKCFISFNTKSMNSSKVDIIDQNGSVVLTQRFAVGTTDVTLPLATVKNGVYMIRITSGSSIIYIQKLIVFK
jgi:large repetitive protein